MATKKQVLSAIAKLGGTLIENSSSLHWNIDIEAPQGKNWGDCHSRVVHWFPTGKKSEFWDEVMEEISLLEVSDCDEHSWCTQDYGECEFWEDEIN